MKLILTTHPSFLHANFSRVRKRLEGEVVVEHSKRGKSRLIYQTKPRGESRSRLLSLGLSAVMLVSIIVAGTIFVPSLYYLLFPADIIPVTALEEGTAFGGNFDTGTTQVAQVEEKEKYLPPFDETLPEGDWLIISRIGVRTQPLQTENPEEALYQGVWWVPDFGVPGDEELPIIMAAHRYGWQWWWQTDYWKYHSFYNLPETEPGDRIEIISGQRKWVYEIYAGEEGEEITDYSADLILYTCKFLKSPIRHFRYARLIDPTQDTQTEVGK